MGSVTAERTEGIRNALAITVVGILLLGLVCFKLLAPALRDRLPLLHAAVWLEIAFASALGLILGMIWLWERKHRRSLRDLGWAQPSTRLAWVLAVVMGGAYLFGSYFGARYILRGVDVTEFVWIRFLLAPIGIFMAAAEEIMMRGFFITELRRARLPTSAQIFASGACSAAYHSVHNPTLLGFLPSFVLFSLHAGLYLFGRRSLMPPILAHSMYHIFGEPYLLMMAIAVMK